MTIKNSIKFIISALIIFLLAIMAGEGISALKLKSAGTNHALIIGIGNYQNLTSLKSPVSDAEALAGVLQKYNFSKSNITLLTDKTKEKPTLVNILTSLDKYIGTLTEKDNLLVFFSGHSTEDKDGETYWIPADGKKDSKFTWLKHSSIIDQLFASEKFKAKNLLIIADSPFSRQLVRRYENPVSLDNLRYEEKILEAASKKSREVIAFGDKHWPGDKKTNGMGLFAFYLHKLLTENDFEVIDVENLVFLFDENVPFSISKVAGTKLLAGRLKSKMEQQGQFIIARIAPSPVVEKPTAPSVNVHQVSVEPKKGLGGDNFRFTATTDTPAAAAFLVVKDKRFKMSGSGTNWSLTQRVDEIGTVAYSVVATNQNGIEGQSKDGNITLTAGISNVVTAKSKPETGFAGEEFVISVKTDRIAAGVSLEMDGKAYPMEGSGDSWSFKKTIPDIGTKQFSVVAKNIKGETGRSLSGTLTANKSPSPIPDIAAVDVKIVSPGKGYAGDSFTIKANTTTPSDKVFVDIDGTQFAMKGEGTQWSYTARIDKLGLSPYKIYARNKDGAQGKSKIGEITTLAQPSPPVNVIMAEVTPTTGALEKKFTFKAKTDKPAKAVALVIGTKRYGMTGSGTEWQLSKQLDQAGAINFSVVARNENDVEGGMKTAAVTVVKERYKVNADGTITDNITGKTQSRFVDNRDGTITDLLTSLMWMQTPKQVALTYDDAEDYCRNLDFKGHSGWRIPTIDELKELSDTKRQNPALPANHPFTSVLTHLGYWSKTTHKFGPSFVYQMNMWYGRVGHQKKEDNAIVWPVRYAETTEKG